MRLSSFLSTALRVSTVSILGYGCGEGTSPVESVPAAITLIPAVVKINALGATEDLEVTVYDALGNEIDTTVTFASGDESVFTVSAGGTVTSVGVGTATVTASLDPLSRSSEVRVVQVGTGIGAELGNAQSGVVATTLPDPLVARVTDAGDNGVAGLTVNFTVTTGGGTVSVAQATTGADGRASTVFTLGPTAGEQTVTAAAGGVGQTIFVAAGLPDVPDAAQVSGGDGQLQPVQTTLPIDLTVLVVDRFSNGILGEDVLFTVTSGGGSVTPPSVATDANGEAKAQWTLGTTLGAQTVEADVPGVLSTPLVYTATGTDLTVTGVTPMALVEGQTAQATGTGIDTDPANVTVLVDGVAAQVTAATATTIDFVVPTTQCLPARDVPVVVTTTSGGTTPPLTAPLTPGNFVNMATGEQVIIEDPSQFCFQFNTEVADEVYLLGVQSAATSGGALTPSSVRGTTMGAAPATPSTWSARQAAPAAAAPFRIDRARAERWRRHREAELGIRLAERRYVPTGPRTPRAPAAAPAASAIPGNVGVGDQVMLKFPDLTGNLCNDFANRTGIVKVVGTRGIWVGDAQNPINGFTNQDYQDLSDILDGAIFDADTAHFGAPSDLDLNDRVVIFVTKALNDASPFTLGFVSTGDVRTTQECASSNEAEIYYGKAPGVVDNLDYPREDALDDAPALIAHEFAHVIQAGRRFVVNQRNLFMSVFMAEGQAILAQEVSGHAALGNTTGQDYGTNVAFNSPNRWYTSGFLDLAFYFGRNTQAASTSVAGAPHECGWLIREPDPCGGRALWYGVTFSLLRWLNDQLGPGFMGGGPDIQKALINNDKQGFANLEDVLGQPIEPLLAQWSAMLYVDGRSIPGLPAMLTLPSWNITGIYFSITPPSRSSRLEPSSVTFSEFMRDVDVRAGSTAYFLVGGADRPATAVRVRDTADGELPSFMQIYLVRVQ